jgi:hypothetical protein
MLPIKIALISKTPRLTFAELSKVAAALTTQVARDVAPIWNVSAAVEALDKNVPPGYWPIFVLPKLKPGEGGFHKTRHQQPYAEVEYGDAWSLSASHELIEMLIDPSASHLVAGPELEISGNAIVENSRKRVEYLLEACDPSEDQKYAYLIDDVIVSDFFTPRYHDPVKSAGAKFSFTGAITRPREVLPGGYISWFDPAAEKIWQIQYFGKPERVDLTREYLHSLKAHLHSSLREFVNKHESASRRHNKYQSLSHLRADTEIGRLRDVGHKALKAASAKKTALYPISGGKRARKS